MVKHYLTPSLFCAYLKTIPERYAATIRMTIPRYEDEGMIWGKLADRYSAERLEAACMESTFVRDARLCQR